MVLKWWCLWWRKLRVQVMEQLVLMTVGVRGWLWWWRHWWYQRWWWGWRCMPSPHPTPGPPPGSIPYIWTNYDVIVRSCPGQCACLAAGDRLTSCWEGGDSSPRKTTCKCHGSSGQLVHNVYTRSKYLCFNQLWIELLGNNTILWIVCLGQRNFCFPSNIITNKSDFTSVHVFFVKALCLEYSKLY